MKDIYFLSKEGRVVDIKTPQFFTRTSSSFIVLLCDQVGVAFIYTVLLSFIAPSSRKRDIRRRGEKINNRVLYYVFTLCHSADEKFKGKKLLVASFSSFPLRLVSVACCCFSCMTMPEFLILFFCAYNTNSCAGL
jgi:hypothetical protein